MTTQSGPPGDERTLGQLVGEISETGARLVRAEIELLERAGKDVFDMCCEAADYLVDNPQVITDKMAIPAFALGQIIQSWEREPAWGSVYGRFDVCFGGIDHPVAIGQRFQQSALHRCLDLSSTLSTQTQALHPAPRPSAQSPRHSRCTRPPWRAPRKHTITRCR